MTIYDFDHCPDRRETRSVKWVHYPEDVLPLWVADMDFVSPQPVIQALQERAAHGLFGYTIEPAGLRERVIQRMAERYNWPIQPDDIVFLPGVVNGLNLACHAAGRPGGGVLAQTPVYPPFLSAPLHAGMVLQEAELFPDAAGRYGIDWDLFESAITSQTRLFILCNPHNPVGRVFSREELARMAAICLRHGVTICSDEIHCDIVYTGQRHVPIASIDPDIARHTITLMAPSKTFNIAGLDCAFAIVQDAELRRRYRHAHHGLVSGVNIMGWVAAEAAFAGGQEWLTQVLAYLEANRDYLATFAREEMPGLRMSWPEGTFLGWLDCRPAGIANPCEFFLNQARVALNDGATFGRGGQGFVRLNFGCPRSILAEALARMKAALATHGG